MHERKQSVPGFPLILENLEIDLSALPPCKTHGKWEKPSKVLEIQKLYLKIFIFHLFVFFTYK